MPAQRPAYLPGHYYHIYNRGAHQVSIFREGVMSDVADWPYSNYLDWIGERDGTLVDRDFVREHFPSPERYREFVADYLAQRRLPKELESYLNDWGA